MDLRGIPFHFAHDYAEVALHGCYWSVRREFGNAFVIRCAPFGGHGNYPWPWDKQRNPKLWRTFEGAVEELAVHLAGLSVGEGI
jgi:hypothetical protein